MSKNDDKTSKADNETESVPAVKAVVDWKQTDLVTCVNLNYRTPDNATFNDVGHFIYASELYGTLFGIYGKFERDQIDVNTYEIKKLSLKLVNYKGPLNIGFTVAKPIWTKIDDNNGTIDFHIMAAGPLDEQEVDFKDTFSVVKNNKGQQYLIVFNRVLDPMTDFMSYYGKRNGTGHFTKLSEKPPVSTMFDSEFNDRDGVDFYNKELKPGMKGYPGNDQIDKEVSQKERILLPSYRCVQSYVNLIY